jgi:uncharacterized protein YuzE
MKRQQRIGSFELSISARADGTIEAAYISLRPGASVAKTKEISADVLMADYNRAGELVGIEILAPVRIAELAKLVEPRKREPFKRFVKRSAPRELVSA